MNRILILLLLTSTLGFSQRGDKIKALKTAFITEQLDLSSAEAEKFWPIYNAHEDKMEALRRSEKREIFQPLRGENIDNLSDAEANALIEKSIQLKTKEFGYHQQLVNDLKGVIAPKKILKLKLAEEAFKRRLLKKIQQRKGPRGNRP